MSSYFAADLRGNLLNTDILGLYFWKYNFGLIKNSMSKNFVYYKIWPKNNDFLKFEFFVQNILTFLEVQYYILITVCKSKISL